MNYNNVGKLTSIRPGTGVRSTTVSDIRLLKYTTGDEVLYKTNYSSQYEPLPEPRKSRGRDRDTSHDGHVERLYSNPLPLKRTKFQHLQQLIVFYYLANT